MSLAQDRLALASKRDQAIRYLQLMVAEGRITPDGHYSHQTLRDMMNKYYDVDISRTPILQALTVVDREGLYEQRATVGASVRAHSPDEKKSLHQMRSEIEAFINRSLAQKVKNGDIKPKDLRDLRVVLNEAKGAIKSGDKRLFITCGREFHCLLAEVAGLETLENTVESLWAISTAIYAEVMSREPSRPVMRDADMADIWDEHKAVFDAIKNGDPDAAVAATEQHFENALRRVSPVVDVEAPAAA